MYFEVPGIRLVVFVSHQRSYIPGTRYTIRSEGRIVSTKWKAPRTITYEKIIWCSMFGVGPLHVRCSTLLEVRTLGSSSASQELRRLEHSGCVSVSYILPKGSYVCWRKFFHDCRFKYIRTTSVLLDEHHLSSLQAHIKHQSGQFSCQTLRGNTNIN